MTGRIGATPPTPPSGQPEDSTVTKVAQRLKRDLTEYTQGMHAIITTPSQAENEQALQKLAQQVRALHDSSQASIEVGR